MKPQVVKFMLMVQDMERAVRFYRDILGFTEGFVSPDWSELQFGDAVIGLHGGGDGKRKPCGLSIQYEDVHLAYTTAIEEGAEPLQAPDKGEGESIIVSSIADTEGNVISLTQYVG